MTSAPSIADRHAAQFRFGLAHLENGPLLRYAEQGDPAGEPLILLHGYTDSWYSYSRLLLPYPAA